MKDRVCDHCGRWVENNEVLYQMQVSIFADPTVEIDPKQSSENARKEYENIIKALEEMDKEQVEEAEDQVYESYRYALCPQCREIIHRRLKNRTKILGE